MLKLTHRIAVYVPRAELVEAVARTLAAWFGGATALPTGQGYWLDDDGNLVQDPTTLVYANTDTEPDPDTLTAWARTLAQGWGEHTVAIEINGALYLVPGQHTQVAV